MHDRFSDAELMERIRDDHDPEAFRELALRWRPRLTGYFRPLFGCSDAADDATQEVLVWLWSHRAEYRATGRFEGYLLTIAKHHWLNRRRHEQRRQTVALPVDEAAASAPTDDLVLAAHDRQTLVAAASELPAAQRLVLELVTAEGLTLSAVADRLGIPLGTVKSRLHHARQRLRAAWSTEEQGYAGR